VTIAEAAPRNFIHFVCENGTYEANGGHPIPNRGRVDFAGFARAAGYRAVHAFSDLKVFEQQAGELLTQEGPVFVDLKLTPSGPQKRDYALLHGPAVRAATKAALRAR
jgi:phosphonopyruvate decarboxylase